MNQTCLLLFEYFRFGVNADRRCHGAPLLIVSAAASAEFGGIRLSAVIPDRRLCKVRAPTRQPHTSIGSSADIFPDRRALCHAVRPGKGEARTAPLPSHMPRRGQARFADRRIRRGMSDRFCNSGCRGIYYYQWRICLCSSFPALFFVDGFVSCIWHTFARACGAIRTAKEVYPGYSNLIALSALCGLCLLFLLFYRLVYCNGFAIERNIGCPYYGVESEIGSCVGAQAGCPHLIDQDALIPPTGLRIILCHPSLRISTK